MRLDVAWPPGCTAQVGEPDDAPPEPILAYLERRLAAGPARPTRRGYSFWCASLPDGGVKVTLLAIDVVVEIVLRGEGLAPGASRFAELLAALDDVQLDFGDEVASLHQLFDEGSP